jgi:UDP-glucuronate 4-epimerase
VRVLVTGAAGFIGSHTCEALVAGGHSVVGIDAFDSYLYPADIKRSNAARISSRLDANSFQLHERDICDAPAMALTIAESKPDVVLHLAALAGVRPSLREPLRYIRTNLHGTTVLLESCRGAGVDRFVFASSSSVYGSRATDETDLTSVRAFREDDPCLSPASPYAATKRSGELLCSTYTDLFDIGISALRFFTVYGPRQRPDMAIHRFTRSIADGTTVTMYGDGSSRRDYTYIDDIVAGAVAACERIKPGAFNIYNLGGTATTSLADLIATIEAAVGRPADIVQAPMQPGDVPITFADITNSARDLDYAPMVPLADGVARFVSWYRG